MDTAYLRERDPALVAQELCDGGADLIQLRTKDRSLDETRRLAEAVMPVCERAGVGFVLNDHAKLALQLGAPVCHLGQDDFFSAGFRIAAQVTGCPKQMLLGLSTHSPEQAKRALRAGPDYIAIGPVFATATKPGRPAVTLDLVRWAAGPQNGVSVPWFAIGGITLDNLGDVLAAGARRVAVVSGILNAANIGAACREFKRRLDAAA